MPVSGTMIVSTKLINNKYLNDFFISFSPKLIKNNNLGAFLFNQVIENETDIVGIKLLKPIDLEIVLAYRKDTNLNNISKSFLNCIIESIKDSANTQK